MFFSNTYDKIVGIHPRPCAVFYGHGTLPIFIDTIRTDRDYYTAEDYLYDCSRFEEEDFLDTLCAGEILVTKIRGNRKHK